MPPFASAKQRAAVMIKLRKMGIKQKPKEIGVTKRYFRARLIEPEEFNKKAIRTYDIGRKGYTKIIIGRKKGRKTTSTQSILIPRKRM